MVTMCTNKKKVLPPSHYKQDILQSVSYFILFSLLYVVLSPLTHQTSLSYILCPKEYLTYSMSMTEGVSVFLKEI